MEEKTTNIKQRVLAGLFWKVLENGGVQIVQLIVSVILARILSPEENGLVSLIAIFITVASVFVQSGFNTALIQKREVDELDYSSVFYLSIGLAAVLYLVLFLTAPWIAAFYGNDLLSPVLRVLSLTLFLGAYNSILNAIIARELQFKKLFLASLLGIIISGAVGVWAALTEYGAWAMVIQQLLYQVSMAVILFCLLRWYPKRCFSMDRIRVLFAFGGKMLGSNLIDTIYNKLYGLVIGKTYNAEMLAYYDKGDLFPQLIVNNVNGAIQSVMLPALASKQDDRESMKSMMRRSIVTSSFIIFPMMFGLAVVAEPLVRVLLTEKYITCVPFLQLLCFSYALWPIHTANLQAINAMGRSDIFLKLEVIKKIIGIAALCAGIPFGVTVMVVLKVITSVISSFINAWPNKKLLNYSFAEQVKDILPSLVISSIMAVCVYGISFLPLHDLMILIIQIVAGIGIYLLLAWIGKLECFIYLLDTIKGTLKKRSLQ